MNTVEFSKLLATVIDKIEATLISKGAEYAAGKDRLSNFKRAALLEGCTPQRALVGMMIKHTVSVLDMVDEMDAGTTHGLAKWEEKLVDEINYRILLLAIVSEGAPKVKPVLEKAPTTFTAPTACTKALTIYKHRDGTLGHLGLEGLFEECHLTHSGKPIDLPF